MGARDAEPLLVSKLCDRGAQIQPKSSIVTRWSSKNMGMGQYL